MFADFDLPKYVTFIKWDEDTKATSWKFKFSIQKNNHWIQIFAYQTSLNNRNWESQSCKLHSKKARTNERKLYKTKGWIVSYWMLLRKPLRILSYWHLLPALNILPLVIIFPNQQPISKFWRFPSSTSPLLWLNIFQRNKKPVQMKERQPLLCPI